MDILKLWKPVDVVRVDGDLSHQMHTNQIIRTHLKSSRWKFYEVTRFSITKTVFFLIKYNGQWRRSGKTLATNFQLPITI